MAAINPGEQQHKETERSRVVVFSTANTKSFNNLLARRFAKTSSLGYYRAHREHTKYTREAPAANSAALERG